MKKLFSLFATTCILASTVTTIAASPKVELSKTAAPKLDGVISAGEYQLITDSAFTYVNTTADESRAKIYSTYDSNNLYLAYEVTCSSHIALDGTDLIFGQHYAMTGIVPNDPSLDKYKAPDNWTWGDFANSGLAREFTMVKSSADQKDYSKIHFEAPKSYSGDLVETIPNTYYKVAHKDNLDIYEMAIPWDFINPDKGNPLEAGSKIGISVVLGIGDETANAGKYICYAGGVFNKKDFSQYAPIILKDAVTETSKPYEKTTTQPSIKPTTQPSIIPTTQPSIKPTTESNVNSTTGSDINPTTESTIQSTTESVITSVDNPSTGSTSVINVLALAFCTSIAAIISKKRKHK